MKFAHISDCHLGSWSNHPDMRGYSALAFERAVEGCIDEKVDFIIIAGDLFDTSLPPIDILRKATSSLRKAKEHNIPVYAVPGSHDFSPTGKTMISVLEEAGLITDICKFDPDSDVVKLNVVTDAKTGTKLAGVMGKKGGLDVNIYKNLDASSAMGSGFKIFVFHAAIAEYRPDNMKDMLAVSLHDLPKGFDYYATGHVHVKHYDKERKIVFPGELFPTSFDELEKYNGGFVIVDVDNGNINVRWKDTHLFGVTLFKINVTGKGPVTTEKEITGMIERSSISDILLLKLSGTLDTGKVTDINFKHIIELAQAKGARIVKRSTSGVQGKEFEEIKHESMGTTDEIERHVISQHAEQLRLEGVNNMENFVSLMMSVLREEKAEDETNATFDERLKSAAKKAAGLA